MLLIVRALSGEELVVASHNPGKVGELRALFASRVARVLSARELGLPEPEESGATFVDNALLKARAAAQASGHVAVADDSGLVVPALDGAPGVLSARWGGDAKDFALAMRRVHEALGDRDRSAAMVSALAIAWPDGEARAFEGRVEGVLVWPPRGGGFGYEPMFAPEGSELTYGEMARADKLADDPRARAFAALLREL